MARWVALVMVMVVSSSYAEETLPVTGSTVQLPAAAGGQLPGVQGSHTVAPVTAVPVTLRPLDVKASNEQIAGYVKQELGKRALQVEMAASPERYTALLSTEEAKKNLRIAMGEIRVLLRRVLNIPSSLVNGLIFTPRVEGDKIVIKAELKDPAKVLGEVEFNLRGELLATVVSDESAAFLAEERKKLEGIEKTNLDVWINELKARAGIIKGARFASEMDEGEIEFLAKEMFSHSDKSQRLYSRLYNAQALQRNADGIQFEIKGGTQTMIGSIAWHYGQDGAVQYVNVVGAKDGNLKTLITDADTKLGRQQPIAPIDPRRQQQQQPGAPMDPRLQRQQLFPRR